MYCNRDFDFDEHSSQILFFQNTYNRLRKVATEQRIVIHFCSAHKRHRGADSSAHCFGRQRAHSVAVYASSCRRHHAKSSRKVVDGVTHTLHACRSPMHRTQTPRNVDRHVEDSLSLLAHRDHSFALQSTTAHNDLHTPKSHSHKFRSTPHSARLPRTHRSLGRYRQLV